MTIPAYVAFFAVGAVLVLIGLVLLLDVPASALLVLVLGLMHVGVGAVLRGRARRRDAEGVQ